LSTQKPNNPDVAAESLGASELRYRRLFESAKDGILILDGETGMIVDVNPFLVELLGFSRAAFLDKKVWELGFFKDLIANQTNFEELRQKEYIRYEDMPLETADGRAIAVEFVSNVYLVNQHRVIQCNIRDITERKRMEDEQRESKQIIEGILNAMPVRVFWKDKNLVYRGCNAAFAGDAGFTEAKDLIGKDDYQMGWRNQAELYRNDDRRVIESGCAKLLVEEPQTTPEGNTITLLTSKIPLRGFKGEINGVLGTYLDITERKRAEEQIQQIHSRYEGLVEHAREGIFILDTGGCFQFVNVEICNMLGYTREELIGKSILDTYPLDIREDGAQRLARIQSGHAARFERPLFRKDGSVITIEASAWKTEEGNVQAMVRDITDRKRAEEERAKLEAQLHQAQKMESVGRLAGGVAHDFNNMLGVILGHSEMALSQLDPTQPLYDDLTEIRKAAERSADLTRQLLAFARRQTVSPRILDLNETVAGMLNMLSRLIGEDISINWHPSENLWPVKLDPSQIDQILANLCVNARDAIEGVGKVTIETHNSTLDETYCADHAGSVPGEYVRLAVSDDGFGMNKETLAQIFEPFFTTKGIGKGTGLGLATVYGAVKQNNGFINAFSEPGQGATFTIYLPRHVGKAGQTCTGGHAEALMRGHETILLVEDEHSILKLTKRMLETQGYTVLSASLPGEAMRLAKEHIGEIHLLMTDVIMPEMNGRDLAKNVLSIYPFIKRLFTSGYTADVIAHQGVLDEGVHFIQKPFSMQDLAAKAREVLDAV
jgi:two-component system, cell cycle sensor histidine kinase and response regulator CckA